VRGWEVPLECACPQLPLQTRKRPHAKRRYICAGFYFLDLFLRLARSGFSPRAALAKDCLLDCFTAVPLALQGGAVPCWLSLAFLRSLAVLWSYERLPGLMLAGSELSKRLLTTFLRLATLICVFAGTMFVLEFLGNIPRVHDNFVLAEMGEISFHQARD
jgi:hypothetical protein